MNKQYIEMNSEWLLASLVDNDGAARPLVQYACVCLPTDNDCAYHRIHLTAVQPHLSPPLLTSTSLLGLLDSKAAEVVLWCFLAGSLLGDFTPTTRAIRGTSALGHSSIDETLVSETLATDELLGEVARIDGRGHCVNSFGDDIIVGRKTHEAGDELLHYDRVSILLEGQREAEEQLTTDALG